MEQLCDVFLFYEVQYVGRYSADGFLFFLYKDTKFLLISNICVAHTAQTCH